MPEHCDELHERSNAFVTATEMIAAHDQDGDGVLDRWPDYWDYVDYLAAVCRGVNAYRGEEIE